MMHPCRTRRAQRIAQMHQHGGGVAVIPTAPEVMRNNDVEYPFRHDSYVHYLSGITEAEAVIVLDAQLAAIDAVRPGAHVMAPHEAALRILAQGMLDTGLLQAGRAGALDDVIDSGAWRQFFMCKTSHWLGMDVHDVGSYREPGSDAWRILHPGMTFTVEPGLYIRPAAGVPEQYWHIGIRIEDDVAVMPGGREVMSAGLPKEVDQLEALLR